MMSQSRCTLSVRGLDCPNEVGTLRAALEGSPGIHHLGFDLIHGMMTVDYAEGATDPGALVRLIRERAGMEAALVGRPEATARRRLLVVAERPAGSRRRAPGWRWAVGLLVSWLGPRAGLDATDRPSGWRGPASAPRSRSGGPGSIPGRSGACGGSGSTSTS